MCPLGPSIPILCSNPELSSQSDHIMFLMGDPLPSDQVYDSTWELHTILTLIFPPRVCLFTQN